MKLRMLLTSIVVVLFAVQVVAQKSIRLDELNLSKATSGNGEVVKNLSAGKNEIQIAGKTYKNGIGVQARSEMVFSLEDDATSFTAFVGLAGEVSQPAASVIFRVIVDGTEMWSSGEMKAGTQAQKLNLNMVGVQYLTLVVEAGNEHKELAQGNWAMATLNYKTKTPVCVDVAEAVLTPSLNTVLKRCVKTASEINIPLNPKGKGNVEVIVNNLPDGLTMDKSTNTISGKIATAGTYNILLYAVNNYGMDQKTITIEVKDTLAAATPPMGWSSRYAMGANVSEAEIKAIADEMSSNGMVKAGYQYIIIDNNWNDGRDEQGALKCNTTKFPNGIKAVADYLHAKGLKLGLTSAAANNDCKSGRGSLGFETQDAKLFAEWGIDYLRYDVCEKTVIGDVLVKRCATMSAALQKTGRSILFEVNDNGNSKPWTWAANEANANMWTTDENIADTWHNSVNGVWNVIGKQADLSAYAATNQWNNPGLLLAGLNGKGIGESAGGNCSREEYRAQMSMWALLSAPLMVSADVRKMKKKDSELLLNAAVIAINQDMLGTQAQRVSKVGDTEVWAKPLADGSVAVGLINGGEAASAIAVKWNELGLTGNYNIADVWAGTTIGSSSSDFSTTVAPHEVKLIVLKR